MAPEARRGPVLHQLLAHWAHGPPTVSTAPTNYMSLSSRKKRSCQALCDRPSPWARCSLVAERIEKPGLSGFVTLLSATHWLWCTSLGAAHRSASSPQSMRLRRQVTLPAFLREDFDTEDAAGSDGPMLEQGSAPDEAPSPRLLKERSKSYPLLRRGRLPKRHALTSSAGGSNVISSTSTRASSPCTPEASSLSHVHLDAGIIGLAGSPFSWTASGAAPAVGLALLAMTAHEGCQSGLQSMALRDYGCRMHTAVARSAGRMRSATMWQRRGPTRLTAWAACCATLRGQAPRCSSSQMAPLLRTGGSTPSAPRAWTWIQGCSKPSAGRDLRRFRARSATLSRLAAASPHRLLLRRRPRLHPSWHVSLL